ncbi:MAG: nucleoside-diphosphate kinase [Gammaproteobacteria bacterium RIFCSPLOWO2_02_FULL_47_50]|jgi:nucleoside-diphosphate kinase|nr:MAG: nucleoside-diphosphate kinase [Gammaproteobacteria bacterium RIFCSPLOWO2_01_FULL_47_190]OGT71430.1 MAG: nucleoside-diphosphate kinase [Gammaproteobacteria bacterium RIFCSPLOWO2_12_47_11]OGT78163.1 MAG: nucleoside-diphosphate kinase [Gammaproteobacteria bacterium RIFCSPLOWO2_02_FULL_47_50]OGT83879.1 MAG: nucleoside-diphosphate kinase [Gammaproteobacteria bacterium RIFCSPLOWO2_12_FULL_47_76]
MAIEQTLSIIKPDAVAKNLIGEIYSRYEKNGLRIVAAKMLHLSRQQAEDFYAVHKARPFYKQLVEFMISGPVIVQVLEGDNAITRHRQLIGATIPKFAAPGTIRYDLAYHNRSNPEAHENAAHGSDSHDNARAEIDFFFKPEEICRRTR